MAYDVEIRYGSDELGRQTAFSDLGYFLVVGVSLANWQAYRPVADVVADMQKTRDAGERVVFVPGQGVQVWRPWTREPGGTMFIIYAGA